MQALDGNNGANYNWTFDHNASYSIVEATKAKATLSGSNQMTYNGQTVTLGDLNNGGTIEVTLTFPGSNNNNDTYKLQAGDFTWNTADGKAPTNVGSYTITLTAAGLTNLQKAIDDVVGAGNVKLSADQLTGSASFKIIAAKATATFSGSDERDYNGQATSVSDVLSKITWTAPNLTIPKLTSDDFEWTDSANPNTVGTYHLQLTASGIAKIKAANPNYSFDPDAIGGKFTYTINAAHGTAVLSGSNLKTYDGQAVSVTDVDSKSGNIIVHLNFPGSIDNTYELQTGDYTWNTKDGSAPIDVGNYTITLTDVGIANLQKKIDSIAGKGNVTLSGDTGSASFEITQKDLSVTLEQKAGTKVGKPYDGKAASFDPSASQLTATGLIAGQSLNTANLTADDYSFVDANGNILPSAPVDAGNYGIKLNAKGLAKLQKDNPNYNITESGVIEYTISAAKASATLDGSNSMIYSGEAVTTANVNKDNNIVVHLTFPGSSNDTYTLQDGDYEFVDSAGNVLSAPKDAQKYSIRLTKLGLQHLQAKIDAIVGANNAVLASENVTATATFTIDPKPITDVKITGNNLSQNKDYNGSPASLDLSGLTLTGDGVLANTPLADLGLSASDFDWYDAKGQKLVAAPTDAGNYQARLKVSELALLQKANPNYSFSSVSGTINYTITPAELAVTIEGSQESTVVEINNGNFTINSSTKLNIPDGLTYELVGTPDKSGRYSVVLTNNSLKKLQKANPNYNFKITSNAIFSLDATVKIIFEDTNNVQVGKTITEYGVAGDTIKLDLTIPEGYQLADGATLPTSYVVGEDLSQSLTIKLVPINAGVTPPAEKPGESNKPGESGKPSTPNTPPTNTGEANNGTANTDHSMQDSKHDSTSVMPHGVSHVENNVEDKQMNSNVISTKQNKLPQTGNATNESLGLIGVLLSGLGIFSLLGVKKRRKDK